MRTASTPSTGINSFTTDEKEEDSSSKSEKKNEQKPQSPVPFNSKEAKEIHANIYACLTNNNTMAKHLRQSAGMRCQSSRNTTTMSRAIPPWRRWRSKWSN